MNTRPRSLFRDRPRSGTGRPPGPSPAAPSLPASRDVRRIADALGRPMRCALCREAAVWRGIWTPTAAVSAQLGAPAGKTRVVAWGACATCRELPDLIERVEDAILADAAAALARPEAN